MFDDNGRERVVTPVTPVEVQPIRHSNGEAGKLVWYLIMVLTAMLGSIGWYWVSQTGTRLERVERQLSDIERKIDVITARTAR